MGVSTVSAGFSEVPRQENDVNAPLKVNRDRSCAEWLSCADTNTQWDESTASFVTTCSEIALCKGYDATTGTSFCSDWDREKPEVIYDKEWYASRDTSWYGNEYSGMAIPNLFPVQSLTQADVSPVGYCVYTDGNNVSKLAGDGSCEELGTGCNTYGICITPEETVELGLIDSLDYALVLNAGSCDEDQGELCSVGYCENNGAACATSDQCSNGSCLVGSCYDISTTSLCQTAADCNEGQTCYSGACATVKGDVAIEDYDAATASADTCTSTGTQFVADAAMKLGSCINSQCLLTPSGETYRDGSTEGKICRAYPESTSPFPNEVVDDWYDPTNPGSVDASPALDARPYDMLSGFENVETCAYGEDCDCSYTKVTFGEGIDTRFYDMDWGTENVSVCSGIYPDNPAAGSPCTKDSTCGTGTCESAQGKLGLCQNGDRAGGYCTSNEQCGDDTPGSCLKTTREDVIYGLNGFCLEKDTSLNILGDREKQACISWLPVDELAGDTDLQAKYIGAGYFDDTYACADVRLYADLGTSSIPEFGASYSENDIACADVDVGLNMLLENVYEEDVIAECASHATCPDGYWALLGMASWKSGTDTVGYMADACTGYSGTGGYTYDAGVNSVNDCPYVCIPYGAKNTEGLSCDPDDANGVPLTELAALETEFKFKNSITADSVFFVGDNPGSDLNNVNIEGYRFFDTMADSLRDCSVRGVQYSDELRLDFAFYQAQFESEKYMYLTMEGNAFAGCKDVVQVSDVQSGISYAWTDRLLGSSDYTIVSDDSRLEYSAETLPGPFGFFTEAPSTKKKHL